MCNHLLADVTVKLRQNKVIRTRSLRTPFPLPVGCFILKQAGLPNSYLEIIRKGELFLPSQSEPNRRARLSLIWIPSHAYPWAHHCPQGQAEVTHTLGAGGSIPPRLFDIWEWKERLHLRSCGYYCQEKGDWRLLSQKNTTVCCRWYLHGLWSLPRGCHVWNAAVPFTALRSILPLHNPRVRQKTVPKGPLPGFSPIQSGWELQIKSLRDSYLKGQHTLA